MSIDKISKEYTWTTVDISYANSNMLLQKALWHRTDVIIYICSCDLCQKRIRKRMSANIAMDAKVLITLAQFGYYYCYKQN